MSAEPPQDAADLQRLVATLQTVQVDEPGRQAIRDALLGKLARPAGTSRTAAGEPVGEAGPADLWAACVPLRDYGTPAWGWCPACAPFTEAQVEALRREARARGAFFGSRYHAACAQTQLRDWRSPPAHGAPPARRLRAVPPRG